MVKLRNTIAALLWRVGSRACQWAHSLEVETRPPCVDCGCPTDDPENCEVCLASIERDRMLDDEYEHGAHDAWLEAERVLGREP